MEKSLTATTYNATGLTPNTPYAWQVKSVCSAEEESRWASSFFKTKDDVLVFATDGNWNEVANWTDAEGNAIENIPTAENNVRIDAEAIIPSGVIAVAKKTTLGDDGSVIIEDGGQLKQSSASLWVTMEKEITANKNFLIGSPFSGTTEIVTNGGTWSHVLNLTSGDYDLYGFDPTQELEWANYKANNQHSVFTAGNNHGLVNQSGYLCANAADQVLEFTGTIGKSFNHSLTKDIEFNGTSTDAFNGWRLIGNPFTCNAYVYYTDGDDNLQGATFYKMNAAGTGYEAYEDAVVLAPGEGAFIQVATSGIINFSSEVPSDYNAEGTAYTGLPYLPLHGQNADQDANTETLFLTFAKEGFATYYNSQRDVVLPEGMLARIVTAKDSESLTYETIAEGGGVVPAATAVLLQVEASDAPTTQAIALAEKSAAAITSDNLLNGSDVAGTTEGTGIHYMLSYDKNNANIGWYWGAANGGAFQNGAHKAYLVVPASAKNRSFIGLPGYEETTGIISIENEKLENGTWYTLDGMKLDKQPTHKGLYIQDGKKVMVK